MLREETAATIPARQARRICAEACPPASLVTGRQSRLLSQVQHDRTERYTRVRLQNPELQLLFGYGAAEPHRLLYAAADAVYAGHLEMTVFVEHDRLAGVARAAGA